MGFKPRSLDLNPAVPQILNQRGGFREAENCLVRHLRTAQVIQLKAQDVLVCWLGSRDLGTVYSSERESFATCLQLKHNEHSFEI